jgi:hypothetical protein
LPLCAIVAVNALLCSVGDNVKGPRLADARPSEKGGVPANVTACNIQEIPGHAMKVAAPNIQEIPGHTMKVAARNIQEIPGHQPRVTYRKYLYQVEVGTPPVEQNRPAPIKMVSSCAWSPGIYRALRLLGKSLDVAWERAFICPLTFN